MARVANVVVVRDKPSFFLCSFILGIGRYVGQRYNKRGGGVVIGTTTHQDVLARGGTSINNQSAL